MSVSYHVGMEDAELVLAARTGDATAVAGIYDTYADRIHDFCCSLLRDTEEGADATQDTFLAALQNLDNLREPSRLRAWLYAIARHNCYRRIRRRDRAAPTAELAETASPSRGPEEQVNALQAAETVWQAVAGLTERDQTLLNLNLRHGLESEELAAAMGVSTQHCHVLMSRAKERLESSIGSLLVARRGSQDCEELARILEDWDGRYTRAIRSKVTRHIESCEECSQRRRTLALGLLSAVPLIPAPAVLRARVFEDISDAEPVSFTADTNGFPKSPDRPGWVRPVLAAAVAVVAVLAISLVAWLIVGRPGNFALLADESGDEVSVTAPDEPGDEPGGVGGGQPDPEDEAPPDEDNLTTTSEGHTDDDDHDPPTTSPTTAPDMEDPPPSDTSGPQFLSVSVDPGTIWELLGPSCPTSATVVVEVDDPSGVPAVGGSLSSPSLGSQQLSFTGDGGAFSAVVGPFSAGTIPAMESETLSLSLSATDGNGNTSSSSASLTLQSGQLCP